MTLNEGSARRTRLPMVWRAVLRSSSVNWAITDQALVSGTNFLFGVVLARSLGFAEYGRFTLTWMAVQLAASVQQSCIIDPMMSIAPKQEEATAPAYFCAIAVQQLILAGVTALVVAAGMSATANLIPDWGIESAMSWGLAAACASHMLQDFLRRYFFTIRRAKIAFLLDVLRYPVQLLLLALAPLVIGPIDTVIALWLLAAACVPAICCGFVLRQEWRWDSATQRETLQRHWRFSRWMLPATMAEFGNGQAILMITGAVLGSAAVGAIRAAVNLVGMLHIVFQGMDNFVPVAAASMLSRHGFVGLRHYLGRVALAGGLVTGGVVVIMNIDPSFTMRMVYGKAFEVAAANQLPWWGVIYCFTFLNVILVSGLRAMEATHVVLVSSAVTACVSLVLGYPLVTFLGVTGALVGRLLLELIKLAIMANGSRAWLFIHSVRRTDPEGAYKHTVLVEDAKSE